MTHGDDEGTLGEVGDGPEPANLTKMAGGGELSGSWGTALRHGGKHAELGERVSDSRR